MSPEKHTPQAPAKTETMITIPDWNKESVRENELSFLSCADEIIANAEGTDPLEVRTSIESLLNNVNEAVQRGEIVGSDGQYDTQKLMKQFKAFVKDANTPGSAVSPFMRIPGAGNLREAFVKLGSNEATGARLVDAVSHYVESYEQQQKQRTDIADTALEAAGVTRPNVDPLQELMFGDDAAIASRRIEDAAVRKPRFTEKQKLQMAREKADRDEWDNNIYLQQKGLQ